MNKQAPDIFLYLASKEVDFTLRGISAALGVKHQPIYQSQEKVRVWKKIQKSFILTVYDFHCTIQVHLYG